MLTGYHSLAPRSALVQYIGTLQYLGTPCILSQHRVQLGCQLGLPEDLQVASNQSEDPASTPKWST